MKDWSVHTAGWYWRTQYKLAKLDKDTVKSALKMQGDLTMQCVSLCYFTDLTLIEAQPVNLHNS